MNQIDDLFQNINALPEEIQEILAKYNDDEFSYDNFKALEEELKPFGYTFDWGLSAEPFNLRKIEEKIDLGKLSNCNLDQANEMLRVGRASKQDAENYVKMWNTAGKRFTGLKLIETQYKTYTTLFLKQIV